MSQELHISTAMAKASIHLRGGVLTELRFRAANNRWIAPLAECPWSAQEAEAVNAPGHLHRLGGTFLCFPYGGGGWPQRRAESWSDGALDGQDSPYHGPAANDLWSCREHVSDRADLEMELPEEIGGGNVTLRITLSHTEPKLRMEATFVPSSAVSLPVGFHPILALPEQPGSLRIHAEFEQGWVHPVSMGDSESRPVPGSSFNDLAAIAAQGGTTTRRDRLPIEDGAGQEDVLQLLNVASPIVINVSADYTVLLAWDTNALPDVEVWHHDRALDTHPWKRRFRGLGIEPLAAPFDARWAAAGGPNPLTGRSKRTHLALEAGTPKTIWHEISLHAGKAESGE